MTRRLASGLLWLTLVLCVPLPFFLVEVGHQPVAAIVQLLGVTVALIAVEGSDGAASLAAWMLAAQALLGMVVLALAATVLVRSIYRVAPARGGAAVLVLIAAILAVALTQPIYITPFRAAGLHATLTEVFE